MNLVAGETLKPVGIDSFAKCLLTDQRPIFELLATFFIPG
jgi:hypothetical protein